MKLPLFFWGFWYLFLFVQSPLLSLFKFLFLGGLMQNPF
ncbi:putative membrane protein [Helicobacter pylori Hp H-27]|nr:putative membrane protein [Helicobacter pylori Hp H-27]